MMTKGMKWMVGPLMLVNVACTHLFFQPIKQHLTDPSQFGLQKPVQDVFFESIDGETIHAWWFASPAKQVHGTIVQFHGNAENISTHCRSLLWVLKYGYNLFSFDYRGYGKSTGMANHGGINLDAIAAVQKARELDDNPEHKMVLYGQSLGGVILIRSLQDIEKTIPIDAVVIESSFYSHKQIGAEKLSDVWFLWPLQWMSYLLVSDRYSPKNNIRYIQPPIPTLVMHSKQDSIVPFSQGRKVYDHLLEPKCFWPILEKGHVGLTSLRLGEYRKPLIDFLQTKKCPEVYGK